MTAICSSPSPDSDKSMFKSALMMLLLNGSWMTFFARATVWAPLFIALAAVMITLSWGIAWSRQQVRQMILVLRTLTAITPLALGIWANEIATDDLLVTWI